MKKLMFSIMLLILFPLTIQADRVGYAYNMKGKCEKTKNRKICKHAIKAFLDLTRAPHAVTSKKSAYNMIIYMLKAPCEKGSNWRDEACKIQMLYIDKSYELSFGRKWEYKPLHERRR